MKKKEYKVRFQNGEIKPLEPIDIEGIREGKIIFFDLEEVSLHETKPKSSKPIWEKIIEIGKSIPEEELKKLPKDFAKNLDHYLYGHPKSKE